jgi:hypothetical protein
MDDAYRCCTLPRMRRCARTSNVDIANTEGKKLLRYPEEENGSQEDVWRGLGNDVALRMRWREALQMMRPSECMWPARSSRKTCWKAAKMGSSWVSIDSQIRRSQSAGGVDGRDCERT